MMTTDLAYNNIIPDDLTNLIVTGASIDNLVPNNGLENTTVKIVFGNQDFNNTITTDWSIIADRLWAFKLAKKKESLLIGAIRNYVRKVNLSELNDALNNQEISEDDYESELDKHEDKFVITLKDVPQEDISVIIDLVNKIGYDLRDFSSSDIAEMFSIKESNLLCHFRFPSKLLK